MEGNFIRELDIDLINQTLRLHQKLEGQVNCVVWDASIVLAKYLEKLCRDRPGFLKNVNVIELGAGVGCVGITAACLGANVLLTDLPEAQPLLEQNIDCNKTKWKQFQGYAEAMPLIWGEDAKIKFIPDIILLADCIYYPESVSLLVRTLKEVATEDTSIFLSQEMRDTAKQKDCWNFFLKHAKEYFEFYRVPLEEQNPEFSSPDIALIKLTKL